jgi:hypothetical protein
MTNKEETMSENLQEQACWLLLTYESGLSTRIINEIIIAWCYQGKRSLQQFFAASQHEWSDTCHLGAESVKKLERLKRS